MPYFLDGNNLIGLTRGRAVPTAEDRRALIGEISDRLRTTRARVVIFFDGPADGAAASLGTLSIRASGSRSADDAILAEIARSASPREIVLVTADRGLAARARDAGARSIPPVDFWRRFGRPAGQSEPSSRVDVEGWLEYFSDEKNRRR